jgi:predicted patatin/cPLA2 family phospholipase
MQMRAALAPTVWRWLGGVLVVAALAGCASAPTRLNPITSDAQAAAGIAGIPGARYWGDRAPPGMDRWLQVPEAELKRDHGGVFGVPHTYLAISGGGADGAFGAGLLVGWTAQGTRPEFTVVTGISTGALIAPFAFLGPKFDPVLRKVYTELTTADLVERRGLFDILRGDSLASTRPLRGLIAQYIDDAVIAELAAQHRRGRSLLIGTTNLDAARPVTWNITRIAASGAPGARDLIHDVILASASIPGVFPPVKIEVEADGRKYDEIHVDGGVTSQVFMYPVGLNWRKVLDRLQVPGRPNLYVIRNSRTDPGFVSIERRLVPIMSRSVSSLIRTQGIGDMAIIYFATRRDGVDFNLAYVPDDFTLDPNESFDREYMRALFDIGFAAALKGYTWITGPRAPE